MFCYKCGSKQADTARYCGACGAKLEDLRAALEPEGAQPGQARPTTPSATPPAQARAGRPFAPADDSVAVESWTVTAYSPDSDGDSRFEPKALMVYKGQQPAHLARLRWVLYDPADQLPVAQAEADITQDIENGDDVVLEASSFVKLRNGVSGVGCQVVGQVLVYPGVTATLLRVPLPTSGVTGGQPIEALVGEVRLVAWRLACDDHSDESATYRAVFVVRNDGVSPLASVSLRLRVLNRKEEVWSTEYLKAEGLASGELRALDTVVLVHEGARARRGATLEVRGLACAQPRIGNVSGSAQLASEDEGQEHDSSDRAVHLYANMEWFDVAEPPKGFDGLPQEFRRAFDLWRTNKSQTNDEVIRLLAPFVNARFLPSNIEGWQDIFANSSDAECPEYEAAAVRVVGVDFSSSPIPRCRAEALFRVPVAEAFWEIADFDSWQEANGRLVDGVSFFWNIPGVSEERDLTHGSHSGAECIANVTVNPLDWPTLAGPGD